MSKPSNRALEFVARQKPAIPNINNTRILYLVRRTDKNRDQDWGRNIEMVVAADNKEQLAEMIDIYFFNDQDITDIDLFNNLELVTIGKADAIVPIGAIVVSNAGA